MLHLGTIERIIPELERELATLLRREGIPGAAIAIVDADRTLWEAGFGMKDWERGAPVTPNTLFSLQSCSKTFTATAVLLAVQEGLLDLDRPIVEYLPDLHLQSRFEAHPERSVTLRHLLAHKSGLTHEAPLGSNYTAASEQISFEAHIESIGQTWLRYPVGRRFAYSNLGTDLAGYILQHVSGLPFAECVRQKLFIPLGMLHSTFDFDTLQSMPDRARGRDAYVEAAGVPLPQCVPMIPSGGLYASAGDVARFIRFHLNRGQVDGRHVLDEPILQEMYTIPFPGQGQFEGYGLGIAINRFRQTVLHHHSGGGFGFLSNMQWYPDLGLGIVFLTNSVHHDAVQWDLPHGIFDRILGPAPERQEAALPESTEGSGASTRRAFVGQYIGRLPDNWHVRRKGEHLKMRRGGSKDNRRLHFYRFDQAYTQTPLRTSHWRFECDAQGRPVCLEHVDSGTMYDYNAGPADPPGADRPEWRAYTGTHLALGLGGIPNLMRIRRKDGYLYLALGNPARRIALRLEEYRPGLFFTCTGEAVDFTGERPLFGGVPVRRIGLGEEVRQWFVLLRGQMRVWRTRGRDR